MLEIVKGPKKATDYTPMKEMKPLQVGVTRNGAVVMRTQANKHFEVMDLSEPLDGCYHNKDSTISVRLLAKGESVTIKLFNE